MWPALLSAGVHAGLLAGWLDWQQAPGTAADPGIDTHAEVELVVGDFAQTPGRSAGQPEPAPSPPAPPPPPPPPPPPTTPPVTPEPPPVDPTPPDVALPPPPPPQPRLAPAPPGPAAPAAPPVEPPPDPPPPAPPAPTPPPRNQPPAAPQGAAAPVVNLGEGTAGNMAEIPDGEKVLRRATADTGNQAPGYPLEAGRRNEQGLVVVRLHIGADGRVAFAEVLESSGFRSLDDAARSQLATWHFKPALRDGLAVEDQLDIGINFRR